MDNSLSGVAGPRPANEAAGNDTAHRIRAVDDAGFSLRRMGPIRHDYHLHPLMRMDSLEKLAKRLVATDQCRFIARDTAVDTPFHHVKESPDGRDIGEVFRRIEEPGSWVALYNVQTDPEYHRFVWQVMESARHIVDKEEKVFDVRGFIFISAPPSVTPFHIDRENNFWLQVHGRKTIHLWDRDDREVVGAADVEDFIVYRGLENVRLREGMVARSAEFDCGPGEGVYFPSTTPHMTRSEPAWTCPGDGVAVSIGIVFYTDVTRRHAYVHTVNRMLRRYLKWNPRMPGRSAVVDAIKYPIGRMAVAFRRRFRGYTPPPGF